MKRSLIPVLMSLLLLCGSLSVAAADFGATVSADYLFGTLESWNRDDVDINGFLVRAEVPVAEPFGVLGEAAFLSAKDYFSYYPDEAVRLLSLETGDLTVTDWNLYATYTLPVDLADGLKVKLLGGYGSADFNDPDDYGYTFKGFKVGAAMSVKPVEKVSVDGSVVVGVGTQGNFNDGDDADAKTVGYRLSGSYAITPSVAVEAGYSYTKYEFKDYIDYFTPSGFFVGAKATF